jgi:hypothetical protein
MDLARRIIGPVSAMAPGVRTSLDGPVPELCLCDPCCGMPGDRELARMSHEREKVAAPDDPLRRRSLMIARS